MTTAQIMLLAMGVACLIAFFQMLYSKQEKPDLVIMGSSAALFTAGGLLVETLLAMTVSGA